MELSKNVHQQILILIPSSLVNDIACFSFYDNHPRDEKTIEITICTKNGEIMEFYQRDLISSLNLKCEKPIDLRILRNNKLELFYLVKTEDELIVVSSKVKLEILKRFNNISSYDIKNNTCSGISCLRMFQKDDAVPLIYDSNFESLEDQGIISSTQNIEDSIPILTELKRKLIEARYASKCNKKTYSEYLNLRQKVTLMSNRNMTTNLNSTFNDDSKNVTGGLKLQTQKPWVKVCNKKIVIVLHAINECKESLENIYILLNNLPLQSLIYTTKIFKKLSQSPHWTETNNHKLSLNEEVAIVAVMELDEVKLNITSRIELSGLICYNKLGKECLQPFEDVSLSTLETMGDKFDVLSDKEANDQIILAILSASERTELHLRHIRNSNEPASILDLLCSHLQMENLSTDVIVYRKSPYHVLNGTMIIFHEIKVNKALVFVHTRSSSQVLALLRLIFDAIPAKIIATTPAYRITSKTEELAQYNEVFETPEENLHCTEYATSVLNRSTKILEHLDNSMIKMSDSKNPLVKSKVGDQIDLFASGSDNFKEFRQSILDEAEKGIDSLMKGVKGNSDVMVID